MTIIAPDFLNLINSCIDGGFNGWQREFVIYRFSTIVMNVIIIDDAKDRRGSKKNITMSFVLDLNQFCQLTLENKELPLWAIYALDNTIMFFTRKS